MADIKNDKVKNTHRAKSIDLGTMVFGKVPPQAKELEEAILGAIMLERHAFDTVIEIIRAECFYSEAHQIIFKAMMSLSQKSRPIDMLTVAEELKTMESLDMVGGPYFISKLTNHVVSAANIEYHCHVIKDKWFKRELIRIGGETITDGYEDGSDSKTIIDSVEKNITALTLENNPDSLRSINLGLVEAIRKIETLRENGADLTGISTGLPSVDKITHGWQDTDLIILAARPSVGKTAIALNFARNASKDFIKKYELDKSNGLKSVAFFSMEMSEGQLINRILTAESEIWLEKLTTGKLEEHEMKRLYKDGVEPLSKSNIIIDETAALNIFELRAKARRLKRKNNIGLIIIDYLQLMSGSGNKGGNREGEISEISRELKKIAKELKVPIIALSQLSREPEKRKGDHQMPKLSDLRESGAIEQDADMVMFLYRPEYHNITANENGDSTKGLTLLSIAKHRNGNLAQANEAIKLKALLHIQKFVEWTGDDFGSPELGGGNWKPIKNFFEPKEKNDDMPF